MTNPNTFKVETQRLVKYARECYEDAYVYHALTYYLRDVGSIPAHAWGRLPWSERWRKDWAVGLENRITEAKTVRDQVAMTAGKLFQVAADYNDADVQSAITLDKVGSDISPYRDALGLGGNTPLARPGSDTHVGRRERTGGAYRRRRHSGDGPLLR